MVQYTVSLGATTSVLGDERNFSRRTVKVRGTPVSTTYGPVVVVVVSSVDTFAAGTFTAGCSSAVVLTFCSLSFKDVMFVVSVVTFSVLILLTLSVALTPLSGVLLSVQPDNITEDSMSNNIKVFTFIPITGLYINTLYLINFHFKTSEVQLRLYLLHDYC
ncbi:MAG: hypothetical protein A4E23_00993 [Methanomethylovorans sp. PtaU1.Bin073]|nr:MAG: hypothetical protein A4E23_00993 [Methanomethylovorans sp. PtaU1.Bin073]